MGPLGTWVRADRRARRGSALALVVLISFSAGVSLTALAGARRTDTAYGRFVDASHTATHRVQYTTEADVDDVVLDRLRRHPDVVAAAPVHFLVAFSEATEFDIGVFLGPDPALFRDVDQGRLLDGRLPAEDRADEVVLSEFLSQDTGIGVGDRIELLTFTQEQIDEELYGEGPNGPALDLEVVGVSRSPDDLAEETNTIVYGSPALFAETAGRAGGYGPSLELVLRDGADADAIVAQALEGVPLDEAVEIETTEDREARVRDATGVLSTGLRLFAAFAGLATLVAVGQALARRLSFLVPDQVALEAMGCTRGQRMRALLASTTPIVVVGALGAGVVAVAGSWTMPIGVARRAEPHPGTDVDLSTLLVGTMVLVTVLLAIAAAAAWRLSAAVGPARANAVGRRRRSTGAAVASRAGWSAPTALGMTMALEPGQGRTAVPVRPALAGAVLGVAGVVAALTFGASLDHLVTTPSSYGWNWHLAPDLFESDAEAIAEHPEVRDVGLLLYRQTVIDGRPTEGMALLAVKGTPSLTVVDGRLPASKSEIALGPATMDALDKGIGDRVTATGSDGEDIELSIVGQALFPTFDENPFNDAVAFHPDLAGDIEQSDGFGQSIVSFTPGLSQDEGAQLVEELAPGAITVYAYPDQPGDVENLAQVRRMPGLLAGFLVLLALAAVGHALVISVRRRRHDLGIVRAVGFVRRQLVTCVSMQSLTLAAVGLLLGVPLGVAAGRSAWALVADGVGVSPSPTVPIGTIALLVPGALVVTAVIGLLPARRAAMLRAHEALAVE